MSVSTLGGGLSTAKEVPMKNALVAMSDWWNGRDARWHRCRVALKKAKSEWEAIKLRLDSATPTTTIGLIDGFFGQACQALAAHDTQLAWSHLSTALREQVLVLPRADLLRRACMHLNEANDKTHGWRKSTIQAYLEKHVKQPSNARLRWPMRRANTAALDAMRLDVWHAKLLLDGAADNTYFKLRIADTVFKNLLVPLAFSVAGFIVVVGLDPSINHALLNPGIGLLLAVALAGIIGASAASMITTVFSASSSKIPEQAASMTTTFARVGVGAPFALASYFLLKSQIVKLGNLEPSDTFLVLAVAFAAGVSERFVLKALNSIVSSSD